MEPERLAGELHAQLHYGRVEQIMAAGLHEYLMEFLEKLHTLNDELNDHFLAPVYGPDGKNTLGRTQSQAPDARDTKHDRPCLQPHPMLRTVQTTQKTMTYCVAVTLDAGMVFASDSRTNAGVDNIASFRKMYVFATDGDRVIVMLTAGNLSITQSAIKLLEEQARGRASRRPS